MSRDPVCDMMVDEQAASGKSVYKGERYYFCSAGCKRLFDQSPESFLGERTSPAPIPTRHPSYVDAVSAGGAPSAPHERVITLAILGMSCASCVSRIQSELEKLDGVIEASVNLATESARVRVSASTVTRNDLAEVVERTGYSVPAFDADSYLDAEEARRRDSKMLRTNFWTSFVLSIPVVIISMTLAGSGAYWNIVLLSFATLVLFWPGRRFFRGFASTLKHRTADMNTLIVIGTFSAYVYSAAVTLLPHSVISSAGTPSTYFDTSVTIITLILLGRLLESNAKNRASGAVRSLMSFQAKTATVLRSGKEIQVPYEELVVGDIVSVKPGEKIAADGLVTEGKSAVDESMITGESSPADKVKGDEVTGATLNISGSFKFQVTRVGSKTVLSEIIRMVEQAQGSKPAVQRLADKIAAVFVPAVFLVAILSFAGWMIFPPDPKFSQALLCFISVLIVACPCALGLATPTAVIVAIGKAAQLGIIIKDASVLELAGHLRCILLDKTGTITSGKPVVTDVIPAPPFTVGQVLEYASSVERLSEHPIARAIGEHANAHGISPSSAENFEYTAGLGVKGKYKGISIFIGSLPENASARNIQDQLSKNAVTLEESGRTVVRLYVNSQPAGLVGLSDVPRPDALLAIQSLSKMGYKLEMLTGDSAAAGAAIARSVGIETYVARLRPEGKLAEVRKQQAMGAVVAFAGDGINDAPALTQADVGIAMGSGTDIAMNAGSVTLTKPDLMGIVRLILLSKQALRTIYQNLFWAFAYNIVLIPLAGFGKLNPVLAAVAMALSSVSVVVNSLRLRRTKVV